MPKLSATPSLSTVLSGASLLVASACAVEPVGSSSQPIIGGEDTPVEMFPATGALLTNLVPTCTGTLVSPTVVLTAAHCVDPELTGSDEPQSFTLEANGLAAPLHTIVSGREVRIHPEWSLREPEQAGPTRWFDIALLILDSPIEDVEYGVIPTPEEAERALVPDATVEIVGYGQHDVDNQLAIGLKKNAITVIAEVGDHELQTSHPGDAQKCFGDSGGPAFVDMAGGLRIAGLASRLAGFKPSCVEGTLETRVDSYVEWIAEAAPEMCEELECDRDTGLPLSPDDGGCSVAGGGIGGSALALLGVLGLMGRNSSSRRRRRPVA